MKKRIIALALCVAGVMSMSGCLMANMGTLQDSTKPVLQGRYDVVDERVTGKDTMWIFLFGFTDGRAGSPAMRALDDAMGKSKVTPDALIEVSENVETYVYPIPFFPIMQVTTRVTGTPVKFHGTK